MNAPRRSDEPIWWGLFSAGGVCFALLLPALLLVFALLHPLGVLPAGALDHGRVHALLFGWTGLPALGLAVAVLLLPACHAAHRIHHGLHDLQWPSGRIAKTLCYGSALLFGLTALAWALRGAGLLPGS